ncbi:MAG: aquaporin [Bacilli bacterium]|nr:aquaporin [Bacilli bacterium]
MKKYISEFVGTFVLVLIGCGVAVVTSANVVATSLAFGLSIVAMAYSIGNVSGCHINPAVSLAMLMTKQMTIKDFIGYVVSQILGAIAGAAVLGLILGSFKTLGTNAYADGKLIAAFVTEVILTFIFVLAILGVTSKKENGHTVGIVIGLTLVLVHLLGIAITGTSVNPARSIGPAIFVGGEALKQLWVFILAPLVGSAIASIFYKFVLTEK